MSGDMAYITRSFLKDYESLLGSASNLRLKLQISEWEGYKPDQRMPVLAGQDTYDDSQCHPSEILREA